MQDLICLIFIILQRSEQFFAYFIKIFSDPYVLRTGLFTFAAFYTLICLFFSVIFSLIYYFLFTVAFVSPQDKKIVLYMNQVGLYEQASGVESMMKRLQEAGLEAYAFEKDGLQAVVSGVSRKEKETQANGDKLSQLQQNYIMKKVTIEDPELVALIEEHKIDEVLERLNE